MVSLEACSPDCLYKLYASGQIFSFMAHYAADTEDAQLQDNYTIIDDLLNPTLSAQNPQVEDAQNAREVYKVALLVPKKVIGRYADTSTSALLAYLSLKNHDFTLKVFDSQKEDPESLKKTYQNIAKEGFPFVIALLTQEGVQNLVAKTPLNLPTIVPTVNKHQLEKRMDLPSTLIFGGIDFPKQVAMLLEFSQHRPLVVYNDDSFRGEMLSKSLKDLGANVVYEDTITFKKASTFGKDLGKQRRYLKNGVVLFNTSIVKTGMLLSQIGMLSSRERPQMLLSSQINFNLSMFMLTQPQDRQNLYITNALAALNPYLSQTAALLNSNLKYDWVGYTSVDCLEHMLTRFYPHLQRYFKEPLQDQQITYTNTLYTPKYLGFKPLNQN
ncbi:DDE transposase [Helicobacter sp. NHP21005]|uniref:transposase n=1 Tax=Helicobacter felistomachi TaxID=3040201 RepID=UPI002573A478|nr:transposase [Helicobacter sp. NHP21005]BEG56817.1 DDE transposase [Helicobacter sp. NHP21005]